MWQSLWKTVTRPCCNTENVDKHEAKTEDPMVNHQDIYVRLEESIQMGSFVVESPENTGNTTMTALHEGNGKLIPRTPLVSLSPEHPSLYSPESFLPPLSNHPPSPPLEIRVTLVDKNPQTDSPPNEHSIPSIPANPFESFREQRFSKEFSKMNTPHFESPYQEDPNDIHIFT